MKTRRLGGALLTLALVLTLAPMMGGEAKAMPGDTPKMLNIGVPSSVNSLGFENIIYGSTVNYGNGQSAHYDKYTNTLTLTGVTLNGDMYGVTGDYAYALYCDGDLNILLSGSCTLSPDEDGAENFCGIYVDGNLTIKNVNNTNATLTAAPQKVSSPSSDIKKSAGIYCTGKLTIEQQGSGTLTVTATGNDATTSSCGVEVKSGKLIATAGKPTGSSGQSFGISTGNAAQNNIELKSTSAEVVARMPSLADDFTYSSHFGAIFSNGKVYVYKGKLTLQSAGVLGGTYQSIKAPNLSAQAGLLAWAGESYDGTGARLYGTSTQNSISSGSYGGFHYLHIDATKVEIVMPDFTYNDSAPTMYYANFYSAYGSSYSNSTALDEPTVTYTGTVAKDSSAYSSPTMPTDAGRYTVTVTYSDGTTGCKNFTISPRPFSGNLMVWVNPSQQGTYNGKEQDVVLSVTDGGVTLTKGVDYTVTNGTATDVEEKQLTVEGMGNYSGSKAGGKWSLKKKTPTADDFNVTATTTVTYDGTPKTVPLPTLKNGMTGCGTIELRYDNTTMAKDAGVYTVTFVVGSGQNFNAAGPFAYGTLMIEKADNSITAGTLSVCKGRNSINLSQAVSGNQGNVTYEITGSALDCSVNGSTFTSGIETGTVTVRATAAGDKNHKSGTAVITVTITEYGIRNMSVNGTTLTWSACLPVGGSGTVIAAWYDANDRLLGCTVKGVAFSGNADAQTISVGANAARYKLFLLDSGYKPLCGAWDSKNP